MNDNVAVIDIVAQVTDETESGAKSAEGNISKLEQSLKKMQKQIEGMKGKSKLEVAATLKDMASKGLQSVAATGKKIAGKVWTVTLKAVDLVTAPFKKVLNLVTNPITQAAAFAGISFGAADTINTFKDFEQGMANVKAISGASGEEFDALTAKAKELGEITQFSASEAAAAMENLAMAGWKSQDIISGMPGLLDLAAAGSVDIATAADVTSSALAQFGMNADESNRVADVLAATATNSKTDIQGLGESLKMAGTQAGALGYSIEDTALAIGLMGNAGVDASSAGTALRSTLARMSKQEGMTEEETNAMAEAMKKVGVSLTDSSGKSKSLMTVIKELRKGFAGMTEVEKASTAANLAGMYAQSGLLAIVNASDESFDKLAAAIDDAKGAASEMAKTKMDTLQGSLLYLQSAAEGVKIAIGDKLKPYIKGLVDWVTEHMPDIQNAVGAAVDFVTGKIDTVIDSIHTLTASPEWKNAETLWDKIKLAWDKLIAEPFDAWWNGSGKVWLAEKANSIGKGIGSALHDGLLAILGVDPSGALQDGASIGKSFADGFLNGFNGEEVAAAIAEAVKNALKFLFKDAGKLLPGGEEKSSTSALSAGVLAIGGAKTIATGAKVFKTGKGIVNGIKGAGSAIGNVSGISEGLRITKAAKAGGAAAQSALAFAENGALGTGTKIGATAAKAGGKVASVGAKAMPIIGGLISIAEMGVDAYKGTKKAEKWNGSDSTGSKIAAGVGAFFGGTGSGVLGDESVGKKALGVGGGALKGAGIGAAIGTIVPGIGNAIGAAVGALVGGIMSAIGGSNISKALKTAGDAIGKFFTQILPDFFGGLWEKIKTFFTQTIPEAASEVGAGLKTFFTETVPGFFGNLWNGIVSFFTEKVPYAIGYVGGTLHTFFTETVPNFFKDLWENIKTFFTETIPNAANTVKSALETFFTETIPNFFKDLWEKVKTFFTETIPNTANTVKDALSTFFTETVPNFFGDLWEKIKTFFTETIPNAANAVKSALETFFTETIPDFFKDLWEKIKTFFTETIPETAAKIKNSIGEFFGNIGEKISGFFKNAWNNITGSFSAGYNDATNAGTGAAAHAEGGIMTQPHLGLVAEDGAEAIIPLSGKRRERGIDLWEKTGRILGVMAYSNGEIVGVPNYMQTAGSSKDTETVTPLFSDKEAATRTESSVSVSVDAINFEINVDGGSTPDAQALAAAIRENVRSMTDDIAYQLAMAIQQVYTNTPIAAWKG